jgi:hypothetical protein
MKKERHISQLLFAIISISSFLAFIECYAQQSGSAKSEVFYGMWENADYFHSQWVWKFEYRDDGSEVLWENVKDREQPNNMEGRFTIEKKWTDSNGNHWYRTIEHSCYIPYSKKKTHTEYGLIKIDASGKTLEGEWSGMGSPEVFGALGNKHFTYYKQ